ncbi:MAG TPA: asparagine synthase (glutamine-hydrolyzing) [Nitrospinota bacterium]|nr:asparagine synthase (glutamine-hydrolyzing) [Nitrospinota bacterium]
MCGITGIINFNNTPISENALIGMRNAISHRGPDDAGIYINKIKTAGLAHKRLSIIDPSSAGHQPMCNEDGTLWITYNGEIYNYPELRNRLKDSGHTFKSNSDTETIVHAYEEWGIEALLGKLRGMFAFAIYDTKNLSLIIARDRLGIKPIYYFHNKDTVIFASEIKAILKSNPVLKKTDSQSAGLFLLYGSIPAPKTIYKEISALEAGHFLTINKEGLIKKRYYALANAFSDTSLLKISEEEAVERVRSCLNETIKCHLISDVPVGAFLSGGIDSTAVAALMREAEHKPIKTVSVVFPNTPYDEAKYAKLAARRFETEHVEIEVSGKNMIEHLGKILGCMDQPTIDGVNTYFVSWATAQAGLKVAMSGVGGDEIFGGYPSFTQIPKLYDFLKVLAWVPFGRRAARSMVKNSNRSLMAKLYSMLASPPSIPGIYLNYRGIFTKEQIQKLLHADIAKEVLEGIEPCSFLADCSKANSKFNQVSLLETTSYMRNQLLRDTDVFSMAHSLEVRVPFVDHVLVELLAKISMKYKGKRDIHKRLLIKALNKKLPEEIIHRPKMGFTFPFDLWLRKELKDVVVDRFRKSDVFNESYKERLLKDYFDNRLHWSKIWTCFVLSNWLE